jgi:prepilin-type N-terminal cleavage/methylation domain-containing protein
MNQRSVFLGRKGFTLIELMVAMSVTIIITVAIYYMYMSLMDSYRRTDKELKALAAFRTATDRLELELSCIQGGAKYLPPEYTNDTSAPGAVKFKPINDGWLAIRWPHGHGETPAAANHLANHETVLNSAGLKSYGDGKCRYLGFYTNVKPGCIDRVEYYFNPAEPLLRHADGLDNDGDDLGSDGKDPDPDNGPGLFVDDRGSLVQRRIGDLDILDPTANYPNDLVLTYGRHILDLKNRWKDSVNPENGAVALPAGYEYRAPRLTGKSGSEKDRGQILADGFSDVTFRFVYTKLKDTANPQLGMEKRFYYCDSWPYDSDDDTSSDSTDQLWPRDNADGKTPRGLSYLCLPLAVHVNFEFEAQGNYRYFNKSIYLIQSRWNDFLTRKNP